MDKDVVKLRDPPIADLSNYVIGAIGLAPMKHIDGVRVCAEAGPSGRMRGTDCYHKMVFSVKGIKHGKLISSLRCGFEYIIAQEDSSDYSSEADCRERLKELSEYMAKLHPNNARYCGGLEGDSLVFDSRVEHVRA